MLEDEVMTTDPIGGEDYEAYGRERERAIAAIMRLRKLALEFPPVHDAIERLVPSARERGELIEAAASLWAKHRVRRRREERTA